MGVRKRNGKFVVEVFDRRLGKKVTVSAKTFGLSPPKTMRAARALERLGYQQLDSGNPGKVWNETVDHFAERWTKEFTNGRSEATLRHNRERIKTLAVFFRGRLLTSVTRQQAELWSRMGNNRSRLREVKAMWNDAIRVGSATENPFEGLGFVRRGRRDIDVLTLTEVHALADCALEVHGGAFGQEIRALILWAAYTGMRPGEIMAAKWTNLSEDTYAVREQFHSKLGTTTVPKHGSTGKIFVPESALLAIKGKPRRLNDDLIFRTKTGQQLSASTLRKAWVPVRNLFGRPDLDLYELRHFCASYMLNDLEIEPWVIAQQLRHSDVSLILNLYGHPDRKRALGRIRKAFGPDMIPVGGLGDVLAPDDRLSV